MSHLLRSILFSSLIFCTAPASAMQSPAAAHVAQIARAFNGLVTWQQEGMALRERDAIQQDRDDIKAMLASGVYSQQEGEELLAEKEADYKDMLTSLRWSHGFNSLMGAVEEQMLPYNSKHEKMANWAGTVSGLGTFNEKNLGRWRKTRLLLLVAELLLGVWQSNIGVAAPAERGVVDKRIRNIAALRRIIRLLHHYLLAGKGNVQTKLSYVLQASSIATAFFGRGRQAAEQAAVAARLRRGRAGGVDGFAGPLYEPPLEGEVIETADTMPFMSQCDIPDPDIKARVETRLHCFPHTIQKEHLFKAAYGKYAEIPAGQPIPYQELLIPTNAKTLYELTYGVVLPDEEPPDIPPDREVTDDAFESCAICYLEKPNVAVGSRADGVISCCGHAFCYGCIAGYITGHAANRGCPSCRRPVNIVFPVEGHHNGDE